MADNGALFYDNPEVFATYLARRNQPTSANDTLELPVLRELLPAVTDADILDLGCGDASLAHELCASGARSYLGIDGSAQMVKLASQQLKALALARVEQGYIEDPSHYREQAYDLVISRLAFHYLESIETVIRQIYLTLRPGGQLVFSAEHPVITSHQLSIKQGSNRQDWVVDRYFATGRRQFKWMGAEVIKYHHTLEDYFQALKRAGFSVEDLRESRPKPELFKDRKLLERRSRVPLYLLMKARKL
ncbi:MAG: SAM-dependent methyltransferase [Candidatus Melainabacteria bacterium HGW-Melainabacteria-1]|nr:MAG: SAM-dependent methyltransferase [Candidatus Melainabacteria bacterium HGW-Melainabacteria-1]